MGNDLDTALRAADFHLPDAAKVIREHLEALQKLLYDADTAIGALLIDAATDRWPKTASQGTTITYARNIRAEIIMHAAIDAQRHGRGESGK